MRRCKPFHWFAASLFGLALSAPAGAEPDQLDTLRDIQLRLHQCWRPPGLSQARPIDISVIVSFSRAGDIFGRPKITYESEQASDNDRLVYRIAVMEALQRCTPLPFTDALGGAVAGRPFTVRFTTRKNQPKTEERRAWLLQKIL